MLPEASDHVPTIFSQTKWEQATDTQVSKQEWHQSLGALLKHAVTAHRVALDLHAAELESLDLAVADEANDACHQLLLLAERVYDQYESTVGSYHRTRIEDHHASGASTSFDSPLSGGGRPSRP